MDPLQKELGGFEKVPPSDASFDRESLPLKNFFLAPEVRNLEKLSRISLSYSQNLLIVE